jgi:FixJ family two-component response regulator
MPVILATGYAETPPGLAQDVIRLGKPFMQEQLLAAVRRAMRALVAQPLQRS